MRRTCPAPSSDREGFTFIELLAALAVAVLLAMGSASVAQSVLGARASALRASRLALSILALEAAARVPEAPEDFLAGELPDGVRIESTADRGEKADRPGLALVDGERVAARIDDAGAPPRGGGPVPRPLRPRWIPPLAAAWLLGAALSIGALPPPGGRVERERLPLLRLAAHAPAPARQRIRIATYNIENFSDGRGDGPTRTEERARRQARGAARLIDALDPDILVIQEIENARALEWLNDALKAPYPFGAITRFEQDHGGPIRLNIALLSRIEPRDLVALDFGALEGPARPPRGVLRFTAPLGPRESLLAYGVHLKSNWGDRDLNEVKRYHAVRLLLEDAEDVRARRPTVAWETLVLGDMNFDPSTPRHAREPVNRLFEGWVDLWERAGGEPRVTVPTRAGGRYGDFPAVAFDRIYAAPELMRAPWIAGIPRALPAGVNTEDADAAPADGSGHVSDHYPVSVDLFRSL